MDITNITYNCSMILNSTHSFLFEEPSYCVTNTSLEQTQESNPIPRSPPPPSSVDIALVFCMGLICIIGLIGNGLVIFVIARNAKMKTVTNVFILNLSIADGLFLIGLPMAMTTSILKHWIFGEILCKTYYILTCINQFTGAFTLTMMSGDRFLAVRFPIKSMSIRTPRYAISSLLLIWCVSLLFIVPIVLYSKLIIVAYPYASCRIDWPAEQAQMGQKLFIIYTLLLGFAIPVSVITILYSLLILRLKAKSRALGIMTNKRSHAAKVTKLVTVIISVFIMCWLPYWAFQTYLITTIPRTTPLPPYAVYMFQAFTILSYANSMVNPILYAYTNENFRDAFSVVFPCLKKVNMSKEKTSTRRFSECGSLVVGQKNGIVKENSQIGRKDNETIPMMAQLNVADCKEAVSISQCTTEDTTVEY